MICKEILYLFCFQTNCSVRHQLLSFYVKNVFSHLGAARDRLYITSAFQVLQANMNACVSIFLRAKLTLSSWHFRTSLLHSFSADREGIQTLGVPHITKDPSSQRLPLWEWGSLIPLISFQNELVGSGQDAGDTMETSHFPAGDVTLCCSFSTKAATRQGNHREKCGSSSFSSVTLVTLSFFNSATTGRV